MSDLNYECLHKEFGARVNGVDLCANLGDATIAAIVSALDEFSLLCFPEQTMSDAAQLALTKRLGDPEPNHVTFGATGKIEYFATIGNVIDAETKKGSSDPHTRYQSGNNLWHSDSSFRLTPTKFSINHAYEVPDEGGATQFASQRVGYARLSAQRAKVIDSLIVLHDYVFSRSQVAPVDPNHAASLPPVEHRLVRENPRTRQKNYYVGAHARSIVGWAGIDARQLIDELDDHTTPTEAIYTHRWQVGDTVIWDNRCMLHRGTGYDADRWRRHMRQTRVSGDGPTLTE